MKMHIVFVICVIVCFTSATRGDIDNSLMSGARLPLCEDLQRQATHNKIRSSVPIGRKDLVGTWVSESCETRPGPEYVTRSYTFTTNGDFKTLIHKYTDSSCREVVYSLKVTGTVKRGSISMITPGGTEAEYTINSISATPHTNDGQVLLQNMIRDVGFCNGQQLSTGLVLHEITSLYVEDINELEPMCGRLLTWNELQLMRIESAEANCRHGKLLLGDLHTNVHKQPQYRPTAYQPALINIKCIRGCRSCKQVHKATLRKPPILTHQPEHQVALHFEGNWNSRQCEVQRYGMFLTRSIHFTTRRQTWHLKQRYYADPKCNIPVYTILASGTTNIQYDHTLPQPIEFNITKLSVRPENRIFAAQLNRLPAGLCGGQGTWAKGVKRNLNETGGCSPIGLNVPRLQPEIIMNTVNKKADQFLYLGQTPTLLRKDGTSSARPTSWSPPLTKCRKNPLPIEDNRINHRTISQAALTSDAVMIGNQSLCLVMIVAIGKLIHQ